jgi:NCS1 family nucleobase:cation symporter-1
MRMAQASNARYGDQVAVVEPYSIEHIPAVERHGRSRQLLWLWLAANLTIADYALGFLPVALGLPLGPTLVALALGNVLGGALLALSAGMGPAAGYPQMLIGRRAFGRTGGYLPAFLNWLSTAGWFTVNTILGAFAVQVLFPSVPFWTAAGVLVGGQTLLVIYGHNLIHAFERVMAAVLGFLFAVALLIALGNGAALSAWHPASSGASQWALFGIVLAASFSYIMSWAPYASDYSRYLPEHTPRARVVLYVFAGAAIASFWLEVVGVLVAILAPKAATPVAALNQVMGWFGAPAVIAIILGATTANALNLYSNTMSARVLDVRWRRSTLAIAGAAISFVLALVGAKNFADFYVNFLLLLDYWITPWLAVILLDFYWLRKRDPAGFGAAVPWNWSGLLAYAIGLAASVPFMQHFIKGPLGSWFGGADLSYFIGFAAAGIAYALLAQRQERRQG